MRFTKNGPNIPQELIEAQKRGELLFFCGAGISCPVGLPTFWKLTENVAKKLHALDDKNNEISELLEDGLCDRAFTALKRTYGNDVVDKILLNELKVKKNVDLTNHKNVLKLSINEKKKPFVITTNFDLLFEKVDKGIPSFLPPYLPDFQSGSSLEGIVYLHGKWVNPNRNKQNNLIISSQDFGRAYLSHGWATRFLSNLLKQRTVVLIGYSGDDTLVRYLLEGLKSENLNSGNKIYAFESDKKGNVESKWSQLGAIGIPYKEHDDLWATINEWAKYSGSDGKEWDEYICKLASQSPQDLEPYERGQVTAYISTKDGARKFQSFDPLPNSEWIYVFDKDIRMGDIVEITHEDSTITKIDPLELYGTDTDQMRSEWEAIPDHLKKNVGNDYIAEVWTQHSLKYSERLSNQDYSNLFNIDSRIGYLALWFSKVADQPAAIWWTQKQFKIHPIIINNIKEDLLNRVDKFSEVGLEFWINYIEYNKRMRAENLIYEWEKIKKSLRNKFNLSTKIYIDNLDDVFNPILVKNSPYYSSKIYLPIKKDEDYIFVNYEFDFLDISIYDVNVHQDNLIYVIKSITNSFIKYLDLSKRWNKNSYETSFHSFYFPSIDIENPLNPKKNIINNVGNLILIIADSLKRQIELNECDLKEVLEIWPKNDNLIFNRLKYFVFTCSKNINMWGVGHDIQKMSDSFFWNSYLELDLFNLISKQWDNLNIDERLIIENKIISYNELSTDTEDENKKRRIYKSGRLLNTIDKTKLGLSNEAKIFFSEMKKDSSWNSDLIESESIVAGAQSGIVNTNKSIDDIDLNEDSSLFFEKIKEIESNRSHFLEEKKPFIGIVEKYPEVALQKLLDELNKNNLRVEYWLQLFEYTKENIDDEVLREMGRIISRLPDEIIKNCRFSIPRWLEGSFIKACSASRNIYFEAWDYVLLTLNNLGEESTKSAIGETYLKGSPVKKSRQTIEHALNSPIGTLVDSLFSTYNIWNLKISEAKATYLIRLEKSIESMGEGSSHAIIRIMCQFNWLHSNYRIWAEKNLLKLLNVNHKFYKSAWVGFFSQGNLPDYNTIKMLKPNLVELVDKQDDFKDIKRIQNDLINVLMQACYISYNKSHARKLFNDSEIRILLRKFDNDILGQGLYFVLKGIQKNNLWKKFGRYFFLNIWPKEDVYQTARTSERLFNFLLDMPEEFEEVTVFISPYLRNIDAGSIYLYRLIEADNNFNIVKRYPKEVLSILDKIIGQRIETYDNSLNEILNKIVSIKPDLKNINSWQRLHDVANHI